MKTNCKEIVVSICCITYNHARYIEQCIEGILMQEIPYAYEIIIHDDCSNDGTTQLIQKYVEKYPDLIVPIFQIENQYQKGIRNIFTTYVFPKARGKYIAICEGDDYWIDASKLKKQVDFLEINLEYSMCFHGAKIQDEDHCKDNYDCTNIIEKDYSANELFSHWIVPTASIVYRKDVVLNYAVIHEDWLITGDVCLVAKCATVGKVKGFSDVMSVYRSSKTSVVHSMKYSHEKIMKHPRHFLSFYYSFPNLKDEVRWCLSHSYYVRFRKGRTNFVVKVFDIVRVIYYQPLFLISKIKNIFCKRYE